ncbi:MAG: LysM peptidoglycan-binding domain-containing protein [Actinobacteria bacterium]|nr:LysM peptidoglycan-binding domain-containing protein [Actinomycetota bacterium]MBV8395992.1 LysM peptidoglycan-binding domain-containing protein [Actinomycetota bacterium]MBV8599124.1 LysM peptidoglycan-binding domain-containing protein [Actinomycetota bacterium]
MFAKVAILATVALVGWAVFARPTGAHGQRVFYRVRAYDTLWTIAASHYAGDPRSAIWQIEQANKLADTTIHPGEVLLLP